MNSKALLAILLVLSLAAMACRVNINLPEIEFQTTAPVSEDLRVPVPEGNPPVNVALNFAAGQLTLAGGAEQDLIQGTATYNVPDFKPVLVTTTGGIELSTGELEINAIPSLAQEIRNNWDLQFGATPMNLDINAGAYQGRYELGGLALHGLEISDGAADVKVNFAAANLVEMGTLRYSTGASQVSLTGLGNANFSDLIFRGGAGDYTLDFGEALLRDGRVDVEVGISSLRIVAPETANVQVIVGGGLSSVSASGAWSKVNDEYRLEGSGPRLVIEVTMGAGSLELRTP